MESTTFNILETRYFSFFESLTSVLGHSLTFFLFDTIVVIETMLMLELYIIMFCINFSINETVYYTLIRKEYKI